MTTTVLPGTEVTAFAAAVRSALSDLPPDELDELTDGLEADLAERLDESPDAAAGLGDPLAYAEELRAAAGYPPRGARSHLGGVLPNLRAMPRDLLRELTDLTARYPLLRWIADFFVALRPVWWVLRGAAAYALMASFLGINGLAFWPVAVAAIVVSVQLGRGWMRERAWARWTLRVVSGIVIIAAPFMAGWAINAGNNAMYSSYSGPETISPQGLSINGDPVDNIFAYDADGEPIDRVQLFDDRGQPLNLVGDTTADFWGTSDGAMVVPSTDVPGRVGWNVFPLDHANSWSDYEDDGMLDESEISPTEFPAATVKALAGAGHEQPMTDENTIAEPSPTITPAP